MLEEFDRVHIVGITERLVDSLRVLAWKMGWPAPRNVGNARSSRAGENPIPKNIKNLVEHKLYLDSIFYQHARDRFLTDFAALVQDAGGEHNVDDHLDRNADTDFSDL
jgi:hypothetical protein